jgi:hypothetical protein
MWLKKELAYYRENEYNTFRTFRLGVAQFGSVLEWGSKNRISHYQRDNKYPNNKGNKPIIDTLTHLSNVNEFQLEKANSSTLRERGYFYVKDQSYYRKH